MQKIETLIPCSETPIKKGRAKSTDVRKFSTHLISKMRYRARTKLFEPPDFDTDYLENWLIENNFQELWDNYINSGRDKNKRPSVDRTDDYIGYLKTNITLTTWEVNNYRGLHCQKKKDRNRPVRICKPVFVYDRQMNLISEFESCESAAEFMGCRVQYVSLLAKKDLTTKKGYKVRYKGIRVVTLVEKT